MKRQRRFLHIWNAGFCIFLISIVFGFSEITLSAAFAEDVRENVFERLEMNLFPEPKAVPDFSLTSMDGEEITLSDYTGKVVFLNFWTTW